MEEFGVTVNAGVKVKKWVIICAEDDDGTLEYQGKDKVNSQAIK